MTLSLVFIQEGSGGGTSILIMDDCNSCDRSASLGETGGFAVLFSWLVEINYGVGSGEVLVGSCVSDVGVMCETDSGGVEG